MRIAIRRLLVLVLATIALAAGCGHGGSDGSGGAGGGDGGSQPGSDGGPVADGGGDFTGPRVDVTPVLDTGNRQTAAIDENGGTVTARAADGTKFTLDIPAGALDGQTMISLIPVSSVGGNPLHGPLRAAAQLEPDGLRFIIPATLTMAPAAPFNSAAISGLAYQGPGNELHRYSASSTATEIKFRLMHFTGMLAAERQGPGDDIAPLVRPADALADQQLARLNDRRPPGSDAEYQTLFISWYNRSVRPGLQDAESNATLLESALDGFDSWLAWATATFPDATATLAAQILEAKSLIDAAALHAFDAYLSKCLGAHDVDSGFSILRIVRRIAAWHILGADSPAMTAAKTALSRCLSFDLKFDSTIRFSSVHAKTVAMVTTNGTLIHVGVILDKFPDKVWVGGQGTWTVAAQSHVEPPCSLSEPTFTPPSMTAEIYFSAALHPAPTTSTPKISMKYSGGDFMVTQTLYCPDQGPEKTTDERFWKYYKVFHSVEFLKDHYDSADWTILGGETWATKVYGPTTLAGPPPPDDAVLTETTTMTLVHHPH